MSGRRSLSVFAGGITFALLLSACPPQAAQDAGLQAQEDAGIKQVDTQLLDKGPIHKDAVQQGAAHSDKEKAALTAKYNKPEQAPGEKGRQAESLEQKKFAVKADAYFTSHPQQRFYIQLDKPLYQPGETIWLRATSANSADLALLEGESGAHLELISPKGAVVIDQYVHEKNGVASTDFAIPEGVQGGEYKVRLRRDRGGQFSRPVIVSVYQAPRFKKKMDFVRKAYGPGDVVAATIEVKKPTGEPFADQTLRAQMTLDGQQLPKVQVQTDAQGNALVKMQLPKKIERGDALLTVLVDDSGITESVSKRVPIVLKKIKLSFFPEGGDMVEGLPARVYFYAQNMIDKPADIEGRIVDDHGQAMSRFSSFHDGMGRFSFVPATGRSYHAEITRPVGISEHFNLPIASEKGCVLRHFDDPAGRKTSSDFSIRCSESQDLVVAMSMRNKRVATVSAKVNAGEQTVLHLQAENPQAQGVARVTVFSKDLEPLAERLVFNGWHRDLQLRLIPERKNYAPRDKVTLKIEAKDAQGQPVQANLALAVVDDTVLSFADDKTAQIHARMLLETELPGKIEEANFYFDRKKPKAAKALDMLMGTRGWRKFAWRQILHPQPARSPRGGGGFLHNLGFGRKAEEEQAMPMAAPQMADAKGMPQNEGKVKRKNRPIVKGALERNAAAKPAAALEMNKEPAPVVVARPQMAQKMMAADEVLAEAPMDGLAGAGEGAGLLKEDRDWAAGKQGKRMARRRQRVHWAKIRIFPLPAYQPDDEPTVRSDFRETIYWNPEIKTDAQGLATVTFYMSDAVTSFKAMAEGLGAGLVAHTEKVISSRLPFHMEVKVPMEVSSGDRIDLPLTLKNDINMSARVVLKSHFGPALKLLENTAPEALTIQAQSGQTLSFPLDVVGHMGEAELSFSAQAKGLHDEFTRKIKVVPTGFPQKIEVSGDLKGHSEHSFDLSQALAGSISAELRFYPSPLSDMVSGVEGMLREPSGCFEQTSSSNYPNIMVMSYLQEYDAAAPEIARRATGLLKRGYNRLLGFESPKKGYEWFGANPGHEALTAYGLMEFVDMQKVMPGVDDAMIQRTRNWLLKRRDGQGGFQRNARALDSFGRASAEITNAYIVYALSETGMAGIDKEIQTVKNSAQKSADPYLIALACKALLNVKSSAATSLLQKLVAMQKSDGRFQGASQSITSSRGQSLNVETTSLAILAMLQSQNYKPQTRKALKWLLSQRSGGGSFGATQSTILALKALTTYAADSKKTPTGGEISVLVNGQKVASESYKKGRQEPIVLTNFASYFKRGKNMVQLKLSAKTAMPYSLALHYRSKDPASSEKLPFKLSVTTAKSQIKMGETLRVTAKLKSSSEQGQPMTLLRIGIPGGLSLQTWQLKELVDKKQIAFYETRARELIVYYRSLPPRAEKEIAVDLVANVPGHYTAPASSSYLYYTPENKTWAGEYSVDISR